MAPAGVVSTATAIEVRFTGHCSDRALTGGPGRGEDLSNHRWKPEFTQLQRRVNTLSLYSRGGTSARVAVKCL